LLNAGAIAAYQPPAEMDKRIRSDFTKWGQVVRDRGIVVN
jgi:tripartite-type tricarboxylate transporter receptor subunit TctC